MRSEETQPEKRRLHSNAFHAWESYLLPYPRPVSSLGFLKEVGLSQLLARLIRATFSAPLGADSPPAQA